MLTLQYLIANKPTKTQLSFGINENVRLIAISNAERRNDDESIINRNTYMTFAKFNEENVEVAKTELSYFYRKSDDKDPLIRLSTQISQLTHIARLYNPAAVLDPFQGYTTIEALQQDLTNNLKIKEITDKLYTLFEAEVANKIGPGSKPFRMKVVYSSKGYPQLPSDDLIVEDMSIPITQTKITITDFELRMKENKNNNNKPAGLTEQPASSAAPINLMNI